MSKCQIYGMCLVEHLNKIKLEHIVRLNKGTSETAGWLI